MRTIRECIDYGFSIGVNRADGNDSMRWLAIVVPLLLLITLGACEGPVGPEGPQGPAGAVGDIGPEGPGGSLRLIATGTIGADSTARPSSRPALGASRISHP